jgi:hypothetical protein
MRSSGSPSGRRARALQVPGLGLKGPPGESPNAGAISAASEITSMSTRR